MCLHMYYLDGFPDSVDVKAENSHFSCGENVTIWSTGSAAKLPEGAKISLLIVVLPLFQSNRVASLLRAHTFDEIADATPCTLI